MKRSRTVNVFCPECPGMPRVFSNTTALRLHLYVQHGRPVGDSLASYCVDATLDGKPFISYGNASAIVKMATESGDPLKPFLHLGFQQHGDGAPHAAPNPEARSQEAIADAAAAVEAFEGLFGACGQQEPEDNEDTDGVDEVDLQLGQLEEVDPASVAEAIKARYGEPAPTNAPLEDALRQQVEDGTKEDGNTRALYMRCLTQFVAFLAHAKIGTLEELQKTPEVVLDFMRLVCTVCVAGSLSYCKMIRVVLRGLGEVEYARHLNRLRNARLQLVLPAVRLRLKQRNEEFVARFPNPRQTLQDVRDTYLTANEHFRSAVEYLKAKAEEKTPLRDGEWNHHVAFVVARLLSPVAGRPGNVANLTVEDFKNSKFHHEKGLVSVFNPDHKVAGKTFLFIYITMADYAHLVSPLVRIAQKLNSTHVFVMASGKPMNKAETIFAAINRGRPQLQHITSNVIRHAAVTVVHGGDSGITKEDAAAVMLHTVGMATNVYRDVRPEDSLDKVVAFRDSLFG